MLPALAVRLRDRSFDLWLSFLFAGAIGIGFVALSVFALTDLLAAMLPPASDGR